MTSIGTNAFEECNTLNKIYTKDIAAWCKVNGLGNLTGYGPVSKTLYINGEEVANLEIPEGTTTISMSAFYGFTNITSVVIPSTVTSIGNLAFRNCINLNEVYNYATTPQTISSTTFHQYGTLYVPASCAPSYQSANNWKNFTIKPIVTVLASGTCGDNLTWTLDDEGLLAIEGEGDMYDYSYNTMPWYNYISVVKSVSIGNNVTSIGQYSFHECLNLASVVIPNSVTSIGVAAFRFCSALTSVEIPNSVTSLGATTFYGCSNLASVVIGNSVTSIGYNTFGACSGLTSVVIPSSVKSIEVSAFDGCSGLTSVEIPNSVTSIESDAFRHCYNLTSIQIPNSVTSIGSGAFAECTSLTSVEIGNSVANIGDWAFDECSSLISINIDSNNAYYSSLEGVVFDKNKRTLIRYPGGKQGKYTIPNSVTCISESAFWECTGLTSVVIGNSVTSIGECAFSFSPSLASVVIGSSVISIGDYAFNGCSNLVNVSNLSDVPQTIDSSVFNGNYGTLYVSAGSVSAYKSANYWKNFAIVGVQNGDVNLDNKVNVTDAVEIVNNVVGEASERFKEAWSDVNSDDQYTIADAMAVVNIIFGEEIGASYAMRHAPLANNDHLSFYRSTPSQMTLAMENMMQYSSFQFDVNLPEGISIENVTLNQNRCQDFSVMFREMEEGYWRVAVFNLGNEPFATGAGSLLDMTLSGDNLSETTISNIHFSTTRAVDVQFDDIMLSVSTDISDSLSIGDSQNETHVYDLSGRRIQSTQRGVNIVNGKKIIK